MTLMVRTTRSASPIDQFNRRSAQPYPASPPKTLRDRTWECTVVFRADGESDSFTSRQTAQTVEEAKAGNIAAAEREYGGDWDRIVSHTARPVA